MASSRVMRKSSRNPSPATRSTRSSVAPESIHVEQKGKEPPTDVQDEAAPRAVSDEVNGDASTPVATVEASGAPEATPTQRVKLRVKEWRPPDPESKETPVRDNGAGGQGTMPSFSATGKEPASRFKRRPSPARSLDETTTKQNHERDESNDVERTQETPIAPRGRPGPGTPSALISPITGREFPSSSTPEGREAFRHIVEAAVERSRILGNELLGLALRRLFEESSYNKRLTHLLDVVLAQRPTPEEAQEFQSYVKAARKKIKAENPAAAAAASEPDSKPSTPTLLLPPTAPTATKKSPSKRAARSSNRTQSQPAETVSRPSTRTRPNGRVQDLTNEDGPPPAKRARRSGSVSSTSSLSTHHSYELENDLKDKENADVSLAAKNRGLSGHRPTPAMKAMAAPKKPISGSKRPMDEDTMDQERSDKKRKLARTFTDLKVNDSNLREETRPSPRPSDRRSRATSTIARGETDPLSPTSSQGDFLVPPPPGALRTRASRGATPIAGRSRKDPGRKTARIKVSPIKKRTGPAGSRMLRERDSYPTPSQLSQSQTQREPSVEASDSNDGDNQDFCSACGGSGELLCCDGCVRSFHFQCLDPPGDPDLPPEGEWYCHVCQVKRDPQVRPPRGLFAALFHRLQGQNPRSYELPADLRDFFEGVKTGDDGEYEELNMLKPKPIRGIGFEDHSQDNTKLKDTKGNIILCFACGLSAEGKREIIACDHCSLKWHLDCLDPPLANAPLKDPLNQNRPRYAWMCPAHAPEEIESIGRGGRMHKLRRPKNPTIVDPQLRRGFRNNGIIEIENDPSDNELDLEEGVVHRVTERSIKLDFIDRVHRMQRETAKQQAALQRDAEQRLAREAHAAEQSRLAFNARSLVDQGAAMSLAQLAEADPALGLGGDQVHVLLHELMAHAPEEVLAQLHVDAPPAAPAGGNADGAATEPTTVVKAEDGEGKDKGKSTPPTPISNRSATPRDRCKQWLLLNELIQRKLREEIDGLEAE